MTVENPGTWVYVYSTPAASMHFKTWPELRPCSLESSSLNSGGELWKELQDVKSS